MGSSNSTDFYSVEVAEVAQAGARYGDEVATATGRQADEITGACSFSDDTLVTTDSGFVPIGELKEGDLVLAWNQALDTTDFYTVTAVWAHLDSTLVTLTIDDEQIETTPEHPFYIADNAWVAAGELWLGARVKKADGDYGTVSAISVANKPQVMYNLTVEAAHTYHVGEDRWLVHNHCGLGRLTHTGPSTWESTTGLEYGPDPRHGNRVQHVLRHGVDDPGRGIHGVFDSGRQGLLHDIDEAYQRALAGFVDDFSRQPRRGGGFRDRIRVDMGRRIGYEGGRRGAARGHPGTNHVRLILEGRNVITAYPEVP